MFDTVRQVFGILNTRQKYNFLMLQILVVISALVEVVAAASVSPFMLIVGNPDVIQENSHIAFVYELCGATSPKHFMYIVGISVIATLAVSGFLSIFTLWRLSLFGSRVGIELGNRLFAHYLRKPWLFHSSTESSKLFTKIASDATRVTNLIIQPILKINAKLALAVFLTIAVVLVNPLVSSIGIVIFVISYLLIYRVAKRRLERHGNNVTTTVTKRYALLSEGFGGIKDILVLGRQHNFTQALEAGGQRLAKSQAIIRALADAPRYMIELLAFASIIALVLYLVGFHQGDLGAALSPLAFYAMASFKLLPAFQAIYQNISQIRTCIPSFETIRSDLQASLQVTERDIDDPTTSGRLEIHDRLLLKGIQFTYPGMKTPALDNLTLEIPANKTIGIVGSSGAGKSTLIDILLGLITPDKGDILVDNSPLQASNVRDWQNTIGFVPQSIFLANTSILANVAFGIAEEDIDLEKAKRAFELSHLNDLIEELPDGYNTIVGERGIRLSGGQLQRIGIARALFDDASLLIFDEATSALDNITEKIIIDALQEFTGNKTIVMVAHRFTTIENCDIIYMLDQGEVVDSGTYSSLLENNSKFREMATSS